MVRARTRSPVKTAIEAECRSLEVASGGSAETIGSTPMRSAAASSAPWETITPFGFPVRP